MSKFRIYFRETDRGFLRADFKDQHGDTASIQESSLATESCIWLGLNSGTHLPTGECLARMHLTRKMAGELAELLQYFADNGTLVGSGIVKA